MTRLLSLLLVATLALTPFGRIGVADAAPHQRPAMQMEGHCSGQNQPADPGDAPAGIDCMIACAAMAPDAFSMTMPPIAAADPPAAAPAASHAGIRPEADPPPPRPA